MALGRLNRVFLPSGRVSCYATQSSGRAKKNSKHTTDVLKYLSTLKNFNESQIPEKLITKKVKNPEALYLVDPNVAREIAEAARADLATGDTVVFEANPGLGYLTEELLRVGVRRIHTFETCTQFREATAARLVGAGTDGRLRTFGTNMIQLWKTTFLDKLDNGRRISGLMAGVERRRWDDEPVIKFVGALPSNKFIKHIIYSIVFQNGIVTHGRPEFYTLMNPQTYIQLIVGRDAIHLPYSPLAILFGLFFDWTVLCSVDRRAFLPWQPHALKPRAEDIINTYRLDPGQLYLVKLVPKRDLYDRIPPATMKPLWFFVRHNLTSKKLRVITQLERWVPGCGPRLIANNGVSVFTNFGDLTPDNILHVFLEFSGWPEYATCPFLPAMESTLMKLEQEGSELTNEDDKAED